MGQYVSEKVLVDWAPTQGSLPQLHSWAILQKERRSNSDLWRPYSQVKVWVMMRQDVGAPNQEAGTGCIRHSLNDVVQLPADY